MFLLFFKVYLHSTVFWFKGKLDFYHHFPSSYPKISLWYKSTVKVIYFLHLLETKFLDLSNDDNTKIFYQLVVYFFYVLSFQKQFTENLWSVRFYNPYDLFDLLDQCVLIIENLHVKIYSNDLSHVSSMLLLDTFRKDLNILESIHPYHR